LKSRGSHLIDDVVLPDGSAVASMALGGIKRVAGARRIEASRGCPVAIAGFLAPPGTWKIVHVSYKRSGNSRQRT
jgi:hypothetical protein